MGFETDVKTEPTVSEVFGDAEDAAVEVVSLPWVRALSGCGFYAKGVVFLVIGALAMFLSMGLRGGRIVDPAGALGAVKQLSLGFLLLLFLSIGSLGHGLWNILRGFADIDDAGRGVFGIIARSLAVAIGVFYLYLSIYALWTLLSGTTAGAGPEIERGVTAILISIPLGVLIVLFLGIGFLGAAIH